MLRVSVDGGGCSGFQYKFDLDRASGGRRRRDRARRRHGADRSGRRSSYLAGSEIDFVDDLIGSSFRSTTRTPPPPAAAAPASRSDSRCAGKPLDLRLSHGPPTIGRRSHAASPPGTSTRIKARLDTALAWLAEARSPTSSACRRSSASTTPFPREPFEALGYNVAVHGQKTFNGVAMLSKLPFDEVTRGLPGDDGDDHARYIEAVVSTAKRRAAGRLDLPAQRQSAGHRQILLQARLDEAAAAYARERLLLRGAAGAGRRLQRHPDRRRRAQPASLDRRRAVPAANRARIPRADQSRPDRRGARDQRRAGALHVLGLSGRRLAEEQRHPHRPSAAVAAGGRPLAPPASTATCGAGRSRPTTCRCGSIWRSNGQISRSSVR